MSQTCIFIEGEKINLCVLDPEGDLSAYQSWVNNQKTTCFMEIGSYASSIDSLQEYIRKYNNSKNLLLGICSKNPHKHIGNITLHMINFRNKTGEIGIIIGENSERGKGYGLEAIHLMLSHAFNRLNLHKINAGMVATNIASKKIFEQAGFSLEGTIRETFFLNGNYHDVYRYGILRSEFP